MSEAPLSPRQSRKELQRERTRNDILDAALEVFQQVGYEQCTMEEIATQAGFSTGALYNYFKNKQDIFNSATKRVFDDLVSQFDEVLSRTIRFSDGLDLLIDMSVGFAEQAASAKYRFLIGPDARHAWADDELHQYSMARYLEVVARVQMIMEMGIREKALRDQDPQVAAHAFMGLVGHFIQGWVMFSQQEDNPYTAREFLEGARDHFLFGAASDRTVPPWKGTQDQGEESA